jgi:glycosyltransferase involved in cell wall biosynthesis
MQDFYSVAVSSLLKDRWLGLGRLAGLLYRVMDGRQIEASNGLILISEGFRSELSAFNLATTPPTWTIPNWGPLNDVPLRVKDTPWAAQHGLQNRFVYLYSGTLGLKHNPMLLLRLAKALDKDPNSIVVVASRGAGRTALEKHLSVNPQHNLVLLDLQPLDVFPDVLGAADIMVALLEEDAGRFSVPSKILSYLCAGKPTVLSTPLENLAAQVLADAQAGIAVSATDEDAFIKAALALRNDPDEIGRLGQNGRRYAEKHFVLNAVADRFLEIFATCSERD